MNLKLLSKQLGRIAFLIGAVMFFSLFWAKPWSDEVWAFEADGFYGILGSIACSFLAGGLLLYLGRKATGHLYTKEAMAVVGLSWVLATILGALPFYFSGTYCSAETQMSFADCIFESQSGFSTTGATVLTELEDPKLVPRCVMFWRCSTQFLGGMGIIVLFVAILGQGSAGKALMRTEMPGPPSTSSSGKMQRTAWALFGTYVGLNLLLTLLLLAENLSLFDAICHSFTALSTGGFSTYNKSVGHFVTDPAYPGAAIEYTITFFMLLGGTNFTLLFLCAIGRFTNLFKDVEWRTYITILAAATMLMVGLGFYFDDFGCESNRTAGMSDTGADTQWNGDHTPDSESKEFTWGMLEENFRLTLFQTVSIMSSTGFCVDNFDHWNNFSRSILLVLMFIGGCSGSTGGGMKVIRHIFFFKILGRDLERAYHPSVIRSLRIAGKPVDDDVALTRGILSYFGFIFLICVTSWLLIMGVESEVAWATAPHHPNNKMIDVFSAVASTVNNIGPGFGIVGATQTYTSFNPVSKYIFTLLMMIGRLEIFPILVLMSPRFWKRI